MSGSVQTCILQRILHKGFIGQCFQSCTGFGYKYKNRVCDVNRIQNCCCIIRVYIADEFCFHLEQVILLCPVFQCKIHGTRTKVTAADSDLNDCCEFFACCICDFSGMNFLCKISDFFLLFYIKCTFVNAICFHCISKLTTSHMVKYKTFFSCIDDFSIVECFEFLCELSLLCQFRQCCQNIIIHLLCCIIISKTCCHGNAVISNTVCSILTRHYLCKIYTVCILKILK